MKLSEMKSMAKASYAAKHYGTDLSVLKVVNNNCTHEKPTYIAPKPIYVAISRKDCIRAKRQQGALL